MDKIAFVILHYNNTEDTINCINSIDELEKNNVDVKMYVVDNCSPNGSGSELTDKYKDRKDIEFILLNKNYGFSYGNNVGYEAAKNDGNETIMVINNDILFEDKKFLVKYQNFILNNDPDIISPDIINLKNQHQNPLSTQVTTIKTAKKNIKLESIYSTLLLIPIINKIIYNYRTKREEKWYDNHYINKDTVFNKNDFIPFGAFIIYTNNWILNEKFAFPSKTFMYEEEEILYLYIKNKNYKIEYCDELKVKHLVGRSTNKRSKNKIANSRFQSLNKKNALKEYIKNYNEMK